MKRMLKDTFNRDVLTLVLVSIIIGSLLASSVSYAANAYFSKTLANLVGDYGEYDVVIQVREEVREDTAVQIQKIMNDVFPGAAMKEGPTITGKSIFYISLPEQYKNQKVYDGLQKTFSSIPGGGSVGVMTEPRLTIRGVPEGAKNMLMERIMAMDGVRFAFHDGSSIGVILMSLDKSSSVSEQIKTILKDYQVIEISFPVGSEPANPIRLGETIASEMQSKLKVAYAESVSTDGKDDDMTYMVGTMMELKRFLTAYASKITIVPAAGTKLVPGDVLVFQGTSSNVPQAGSAPDKGNVQVTVNTLKTDGTAEGTVQQGDAAQITNPQGYILDKGLIGAAAATVNVQNPRQELSNALNETSKLVGQIPGFAQDTQNLSNIAIGALDSYGGSLNAIEQTLSSVQNAGSTIQTVTSGLAGIDTTGLQNQLDSSANAMGGLINTLQVVKLLQPDVGSSIDGLASTQQNLIKLKSSLGSLDRVAADARRAKNTIDNIVANGDNALDTLRAFDVAGARNNLTSANSRLAEMQKLDTPLISAQLQYLSAAAPNLKDEDISHSVALLDKFIAGQVIPGARIQILTTSNIGVDAVTPLVQQQIGHNNVSVYSTVLGAIEPNARGEVYQILQEVKGVLAGMTAIIMTILFLGLDHTAVMTVIRRRRMVDRIKPTGWKGRIKRMAAVFTAPERQYGMFIGASMLTAMFVLSGGGIPYLPWIGVPLLGALTGLIIAGYTEKISPVSPEEIMAGESLGLSFDQIMREIVVPGARPGLLQKLNSRKLKFK